MHCSDVAAGKGTTVATATREVATALADVSEALDATGATYLLYWRGLLFECIENEERAKEDLTAFTAAVAGDPVYLPQFKDANKRLDRIGRSERRQFFARPSPGGAVLGFGLLGAGGVFGGLAGWQAQELQTAQAAYRDEPKPWAERSADLDVAQSHADPANAMIGAAIGSGVAGAVALLVSSAVEARGKSAARVSAAVVPMPGGVLVCLELHP